MILVSKEAHQNTLNTYSAIRAHVPLFERNGKLVTIGETELPSPERLPGAEPVRGGAKIAAFGPVNEHYLRANLSKHLKFKVHNKEGVLVKADAPLNECKLLINAPKLYGVPQVDRLVGSPFLLETGEIISKAGYHAETKIYLFETLEVDLTVPQKPTREEALRALRTFHALLREFPFKDRLSLSAALSLILHAAGAQSDDRSSYARDHCGCARHRQGRTGGDNDAHFAQLRISCHGDRQR